MTKELYLQTFYGILIPFLGTSSGAGQVARKVLDAYFAGKQTGETPTESAVLLP